MRMTYQCAKAVDIPVIGCGGVSSVEDVVEYLIAGATAVQVGTATFIRPTTMVKLIEDLEFFVRNEGLESVQGLIGSVRDNDAADSVVFMEAAP